MNKIIKIAIALLILGFVGSVVFTIVSGTSFGEITGTESYEYIEKTYTKDQFAGFDFSLANKSVIILPSETDDIVIKYYESELNWIEIDETGSTLVFDNKTKWYVGMIWGWNWYRSPQYQKLYLYVPLDIVYSYRMDSSNGNFTMSEGINASSIDFLSSNGDMTLTDIQVTGSIHVKSSNGNLTLTNVVSPTSVDARTSNGRIVFSDVSASSILARSSNGRISGTGIDTPSLDAQTSNGLVDVTVSGSQSDYHLTMATSNGSYYLNGTKVTTNSYNTDKTNTVRLVSSNGDVKVRFSE
jgi:hypothetical protein